MTEHLPRGWIVLLGPGYPARVSAEDLAVAWFLTHDEAVQWCADHPKAKGAYPAELRRSTP